jgi:signal transduction histidine kinase
MKKSVWYRIALVAAIVVVLLNTFLAARSLHTLINSQFWLAHTLEVIDGTEQIVARVRTAESAARGYILTGSPVFAQEYSAASSGIGAGVDRIQRLTRDNPSQQLRIRDLRLRIGTKMAVLDAGMAVRRGAPGGTLAPSALQAVVNDTPNRVQSVQATIDAIEAQERGLLALRTADARTAQRRVWISFTIAFILDFVLLVAAFELLVRVGRERENLAESAAEVLSLNKELTQVNAGLELRVQQRTQQLAFSNQELEAFSYSVSHDLRAPLRTIDGFSLALLEDYGTSLTEEGRDYIHRVRNGVQRMGTLIDALLQLSRVTRSELQTESVDLSQLATLVFNELQASDPQRHVDFTAQPGVTVRGDPRLLRIALENLIGNAWKFTSREPHARIQFGTMPGRGELAGQTAYFVRDNGAGFDMQYVDRLFTAFQRLHGDRDFKGSGIGLATVLRIVRRHHGSIAAESGPGNGAVFYFTLPGI